MRLNRSAMTLAELIIATLITSIMLAGIMSADHSIRVLNRDITGDVWLSMQTGAIYDAIRADATRAIGHSQDQGVVVSATDDNNNYFCFRHDNANPHTPAIFTDDNWVCYTLLGASGPTRTDLHRCQKAAGAAPAACVSTDPFIGVLRPNLHFTNPATFSAGVFRFKIRATRDKTAGENSVSNPWVEMNLAVAAPSSSTQ